VAILYYGFVATVLYELFLWIAKLDQKMTSVEAQRSRNFDRTSQEPSS
jgi:hypothetical protein